MVVIGNVRRRKRSYYQIKMLMTVFSSSQAIYFFCVWVGEAFALEDSSSLEMVVVLGLVAFLTVIYDAFLAENEMENGIETLTSTWTELGIFDESSLSPSLFPSLNYVLVKFP